MFNTLAHFGATKKILKKEENGVLPFKHDQKGAIRHGAMVLVSKDLAIDNNDHRKKLSEVFPRYKYQTFDKSKDTSTSIMNKINTFFEKVFRGSRDDAIPRFDSFVEPMITNVLLVTFCNIQLKWGYDNNDLYGTSIDFYKSKEDSKGKTVKVFCISGVKKCATAIFDDEYLVLRIPVNRIGNDCLIRRKRKNKILVLPNLGAKIQTVVLAWKKLIEISCTLQ